MEMYVALSGIEPSQERWRDDLLAQFLPKFKDGKPIIENGKMMHQRLIVSPITIYKIAFHKENLDTVTNMVIGDNYVLERYSSLRYLAKFFRKLFGLKEIQRPKQIYPFTQPNPIDKAVAVIPIGIKEDGHDDLGNELI